MRDGMVKLRAKLAERLERIAVDEDMSLDELVDHILRGYSEQFSVDEDEEDAEEEE